MKINSLVKMKMVRKICFLYIFILGLYQTNILGGCNCKRRNHINNQQNIEQNDKTKNLLNNIKSKYILNKILNNTNKTAKLKVIRYNKITQKRSGLSIIDYMDVCILKNYIYNIELTFYDKGIDIKCILKKIIDILKERYHVQEKDNTNENNNNIEKDPLYKINGKSILIYEVKENDNNTVTISLNSLIGGKIIDGKIIEGKNSNPEVKNDWSDLKDIVKALEEYKIGLKLTSKHNLFTSCERMFEGFSNCKTIDLSEFNTSNVTNMSYMFCGCSFLVKLDIENFNTNNVTNMSGMFSECS